MESRSNIILKSVALTSGKAALTALKGARSVGHAVADKFRDVVHNILNEESATEQDGDLKAFLKAVRKKALTEADNAGKEIRLFEQIDRHHTPVLADDHETDVNLKADIADDLTSRVGKRLPLVEVIERIASSCFYQNIPAERLIEFLETDEVLKFVIMELLKFESSKFRGTNVNAFISSAVESAIHKLEIFARNNAQASLSEDRLRIQLRPVTPELEIELKAMIADFKESYNPKDKRFTLFKFIAKLSQESSATCGSYSEYNILGWLKGNSGLLSAILRGRAEADYDPKRDLAMPRHIATVVNELYEEKGKIDPDKFLDLNLDKFFIYELDPDPAFLRRSSDKKPSFRGDPVFILDIPGLKRFFSKTVPKLQSSNSNLIILRKKIIEKVLAKIDEKHAEGHGFSVKIRTRKGRFYTPQDRELEVIKDTLAEFIRKNCRIATSHLDASNILVDPLDVPDEIQRNYEQWFDKGNLKIHPTDQPYYDYLRSIFGEFKHRKEEGKIGKIMRPEPFENIRERVARTFSEVNSYLMELPERQGKPPITFQRTLATNDYAELTKIVCTTLDPAERFVARLKIELATVVHDCMDNIVYSGRDNYASKVKEILESKRSGIRLTPEKGVRKVRFLDLPDGHTRILGEDEMPEVADDRLIGSFDLLPGEFDGVSCYYLPSSNGEQANYINVKTLFSAVNSLLAETDKKKRADQITDWLRLTIVVDKLEDLVKIQESLESKHASFGKALKRENKYEELEEVSSFNVAESAAKSADYKTLRYVMKIKVPNKKGAKSSIPIEIRVLLTEDMVNDKSLYHKGSHRNYKKRQMRTSERRVAPVEIFPERYKDTASRPTDVFRLERMETVLKEAEDYQ